MKHALNPGRSSGWLQHGCWSAA